MSARPKKVPAKRVIIVCLLQKLGRLPEFEMLEDGDGWAFWITEPGCEGDSTSYVRNDMSIEWHGTNFGASP